MKEPRVLFAGTPEFALGSLKALVKSKRVPIAVLTQPDRPAGRGKKIRSSPVKDYCIERNIPVLQPATLKSGEAQQRIAALEPDIMIVAAYGLILPQTVLDIPAKGCLNVHASLLPRWRGAAPIQAAILSGDTQSGVSLMQMTAGLDCGPVFATAATDIGEQETAGELQQRLTTLGGELLVDKFDAILAAELRADEQDEAKATYARKISTNDAKIDWSLPAAELARHVRAYNPVPGAWFMHDDERVKCWRASVANGRGAVGTILTASSHGIVVACGDAAISLQELQRPGRRASDAATFIAQRELNGKTLG